MLRATKYFIFAILLTGIVASCGRSSRRLPRYTLQVTLDGLERDSVSLWVYLPEYDALHRIAGADCSNGSFTLTGEIENPTLAALQFDVDSIPYYFILEPDSIAIILRPDCSIITGGDKNHEYALYEKHRAELLNRLNENNRQYLAAAEQGRLTLEKERQMLQTDSLTKSELAALDSVSRSRQDVVGMLIRLTKNHR